jgi:phosphohistidine swiveling domain-containing protein
MIYDPRLVALPRPGMERRDSVTDGALGSFYGSDEFPIEWDEGERDLFWIFDDLHIPNPVSPMFFDIGGWWLTCDHMFRRFGTPFACDWVAKRINGYVYTAAIPCDPDLHAEAQEYRSRYVPRVPRVAGYAGRIGAYLGWVLPHYAANFMDWWRDRLRPEIERNFARIDAIDLDAASLVSLAVLLEDAIDMHDRHWKIHWMLNFAQFASSTALAQTAAEVRGEVDPELLGRLQGSLEDRNWDSIEDLWRLKEQVKADPELLAAFDGATAGDVLQRLRTSERGRRFIDQGIEPHQTTFGYKSIWSHEFAYPTWREDPAPIVAAIGGYVATDYDYHANLESVRADQEEASRELLDGVTGEGLERLERALELSLRMNPLTPDHHFYVDQGTNARLRIVLIAIGRKLAADGVLDDPEDVVYLHYDELRQLMADSSAHNAKALVSDRRDERDDAAEVRPPSWVGTVTQEALDFPYAGHWGFPEKFHAGEPTLTGEVRGLGASAGVVEGRARFVSSPEEFSEVAEGDILVCRMTNPAWIVVFTKIRGLITEAGGAMSHPAVTAREFGIPAVVGTSNAGERIRTGDRVRLNGTTGVVEILSP